MIGLLVRQTVDLAAAPVSETPMPRVETGLHSGPIYWSEPFADGERLVTASGDKTLRVWRTRDLKPLLTLRIPIANKQEGRLAFADVSRDGRLIAAGGWTCWDWEGKGCVYLFDAEHGRLVKRIGGLPNIIGNLRFSSDGKQLAVGMHGDGGVAFIDVESGNILASDREYRERITGLDFSSDGYLAAGALDGFIRVYDPQRQLRARVPLDDSKRIGAVYFSPDRTRLLIGAYDRPRLKIVALPELNTVAEFSAADIPNQVSLRNAVWSHSGKTIYAVGDSKDLSRGLIFRWNAADPRSRTTIEIPVHRAQCVRPLGADGLLFSTEDSVIGIVDDEGRLARISDAAVSAFPQQSDRFRISSDGTVVDFPRDRTGMDIGRFDVARLALHENPGAPRATEAAKTRSARLSLTGWRNSAEPSLNGKRLKLDSFEEVRSYAMAQKQKFLVLGTEWSLRAYRPDGAPLWHRPTPAAVWNTVVTRDGRWIAAALADGTVRWYESEKGAERLALFPHPNRKDWILWRPDGYYASSDFGDNFVGWHVNRGLDTEPDFYRAVQFERLFYRPDLLKAELSVPGGAHAANEAARARGRVHKEKIEPVQTIDRLLQIAPPRIRLTGFKHLPAEEGTARAEISVEAEAAALPMRDLTLFVNLIPVTQSRDRSISGSERFMFRRTFTIPVRPGDNDLRIEVGNGTSMGLREQLLEVAGMPDTQQDDRGDLYLLAVGVNHFEQISGSDKDRLEDLRFAVNDAEAIAKWFQSAAGISFRRVHVRVLTDPETPGVKDPQSPDAAPGSLPRRQAILDALPFLESAGARDTAAIFLASHGFSDAAGNYFFVPKDARMADIDDILEGRNTSGQAPSLLSWLDFFEAVRKAAGRRLLLVDACEAKNIQGTFDEHSLRKRSAAALFPLLLASKGSERSQEYAPAQHGLFSYALLQGLEGRADSDNNLRITIGELHQYAETRVRELHNPLKGPQTPQLVAPEQLRLISLINNSLPRDESSRSR